MNRIARVPVLAAAALSLLVFSAGCKELKARDQLAKGVQAYKGGKIDEAIDHFQNAVNLDPKLPMTRIFLATAYMQQVVPDLTNEDNLKKANMAIDAFKQVLEEHPNDTISLKGIAALYYDIDKFDESKEWQRKVMQADPTDATAPYTIAVIDWHTVFKNTQTILGEAGLTNDENGNTKMSKQTCEKIKAANTDLINQSLQNLNKAVELRPNYDDAMSYLSLTYRRKADVDCGDANAVKDDIAQAQHWNDKNMQTRKQNEIDKEKKSAGGVVLDPSK